MADHSKELCAGCDQKGTLKMEMKSIPFGYGAEPKTITLTPEPVPVWRCKKCGFSFTDGDTEGANDRARTAYHDVLAVIKKHGIDGTMRSLLAIAQHYKGLYETAKKLRGRYLDSEARGAIGKTFDEWRVAYRRAREFAELGDLEIGDLYRWLGSPDTWTKRLGSENIVQTAPVNDHE